MRALRRVGSARWRAAEVRQDADGMNHRPRKKELWGNSDHNIPVRTSPVVPAAEWQKDNLKPDQMAQVDEAAAIFPARQQLCGSAAAVPPANAQPDCAPGCC